MSEQVTTTPTVPDYMSRDTDSKRLCCRRCAHLLGNDFGRRIEIVDSADVVVHIITTDYAGRCPRCFEFFRWNSSKRKSS